MSPFWKTLSKKGHKRIKNVLLFNFYHTIPTFNDPKEEGFGKHCGKRRKCWLLAFSPFPTVFSTQREKLSF